MEIRNPFTSISDKIPDDEREAVTAALDRKTDAINQRIDKLKVFVVSEEIRSDLQEGDRLRAEATL